MIGIVVAMHGGLADAFVVTARKVLPETQVHIEAVGFVVHEDSANGPSDDTRLHDAVERVRGAGGVLILTDMFGGTPSNVGMTLHRSGEVEVLTGANLPMVVKAIQVAQAPGIDLMTASRQVKAAGERAISVATDVLTGGKGGGAGQAHGEAHA